VRHTGDLKEFCSRRTLGHVQVPKASNIPIATDRHGLGKGSRSQPERSVLYRLGLATAGVSPAVGDRSGRMGLIAHAIASSARKRAGDDASGDSASQ
jgi:hypothetical protein